MRVAAWLLGAAVFCREARRTDYFDPLVSLHPPHGIWQGRLSMRTLPAAISARAAVQVIPSRDLMIAAKVRPELALVVTIGLDVTAEGQTPERPRGL